MAVLYRCTTPTDYLCRCGAVARSLRRHGIDYESVRVPLRRSRRPEVVELSGQSRVPLLVIAGEVICDSHRIIEYLRAQHPDGDPGRSPSGQER